MNSLKRNIIPFTLYELVFNLLNCVKIYRNYMSKLHGNGPFDSFTALLWIVFIVLRFARQTGISSDIQDIIDSLRCLNFYVLQILPDENELQILISCIKQTINETNGDDILSNIFDFIDHINTANFLKSRNKKKFLFKEIMLIILAELQEDDRK